MLELKEALDTFSKSLAKEAVTGTENLNLLKAHGRILANDIQSTINVPPADNSAMDGYAIQTNDITSLPSTLRISQRITAGSPPQTLESGTAARVFTGAELPELADCVVIQENCVEEGGKVTINEGVKEFGNIRAAGQDIKKSDTVFEQGHRIKSQDIGLLSSIGLEQLEVTRKLKVSILSTGDELVAPGKPLGKAQIYDSNRPMIQSVCEDMKCHIASSVHIGDSHAQTVETLLNLSEKSDLIISCGGVSVGEEDHVKNALLEIGEIDHWKIRMKPGKPVAIGKIFRKAKPPCFFIGLPGNPVSAYVTLHLFGRQIIAALQGDQAFRLDRHKDLAAFETSGKNKRPEFIRVKRSNDGLIVFPNQSSGVLSSVTWADALALIPEQTRIKPGDFVEIFPV